MNKDRIAVVQGMISYIRSSSQYQIDDVAKMIKEPLENMPDILNGKKSLKNFEVEQNLICLYVLTLDLVEKLKRVQEDDNADL